MRILVVEDDADLLFIVGSVLHLHGFECDTASTRAQAKRRLENNHYAAVLLDLVLPDGSGLDLLPSLQGTNVIVTSGNVSQALRSDARVHRVFEKPYDLNLVADCLAKAVHAD